MIEKHIKALLYDHDCVVIPGFGGFIAEYIPAEIHPIRHTFLPSSKNIAFNEKLKTNDGLLQTMVASAENLSPEEAEHEIKSYVFELKKHIKEKNRYTFEEVGTLFINHEYRLQFEPENKVNFNNNSFGLPELYCKPITREPAKRIVAINKDRAAVRKALRKQKGEDQEMLPEGQNYKKPVSIWPIIVFPLITALAIGAFFMLRNLQESNSLSSINPFAIFSDPAEEVTTEGPTAEELEKELLSSNNEVTNLDQETNTEEGIENNEVDPFDSNTTFVAQNSTSNIETETEAPIAEVVQTKPVAEPAKTETKEVVKETEKATVETTKPATPVTKTENTTVATTEVVKTDEKVADVLKANAVPRYYIISGGFSNKDNAFKHKAELNKKGLNAKVIEPASATGMFKVTMNDFDNVETAKIELDKLKNDYGKDLWIFKY